MRTIVTTESFGAALAEQREARQLHPKELAKLLGVSAQTITNYERAEREPKPLAVFQLEDLLGLPAGTLSHHLGYLPVGVTDEIRPGLIETISATDELDDERRTAVLEVARVMLRHQHGDRRS